MLCLNYALELTRGNPLGLSALLSRFDLNSGIFTGIAKADRGKQLLAGQVAYNLGERSAGMTFLLPDQPVELAEYDALVDYLAEKAGEMGALNLLADIAESHPAFELLRKHAFSVYCWENTWKLPSSIPSTLHFKDLWHEERETDEQAIRSLYQTVVPPLVQTAEPFSTGTRHRLIYRQQGELMGFIDNVSGPNGIYLKPVIHPSVEDIRSLVGDLMHTLQPIGKPVYFPVRSYQAWVSDALDELGATSSPRRASMVKHLALAVLSENGSTVRQRIESRSAETSASMVSKTISSGQDLE